MDHKTKEELKALSKEVFGASSRWEKLVKKGYSEVLTEEVTEMVPSSKEGEPDTEQKIKKPVLRSDGSLQSVTKYHTPDSVRTAMVDMKARRDAYLEAVKKAREEQRLAKEKLEMSQKVQELAGGSATG